MIADAGARRPLQVPVLRSHTHERNTGRFIHQRASKSQRTPDRLLDQRQPQIDLVLADG